MLIPQKLCVEWHRRAGTERGEGQRTYMVVCCLVSSLERLVSDRLVGFFMTCLL